MIRDAKNVFCESQAVTNATVNTDNLIFEDGEIGPGEPKRFYFVVDTAFAGTGTLTFTVQAGDGTTYHDLAASQAFSAADLVAGKTFEGYLPIEIGGTHLRASLVGDTPSFSAGAVTAGLRY